MDVFTYWQETVHWLDTTLKRGRKALYRATRLDAAGVWHDNRKTVKADGTVIYWSDGTTIHQRVSAQLDERRHDLDAARCELQMARNRAKPRRTWIEARGTGETLPFAMTAGASMNGAGM